MLATASGRLHCKGLPLPPEGQSKENQDWDSHPNSQRWDYHDPAEQVSFSGSVTAPHRVVGYEETPEDIFESRVRDGREGDLVRVWCEYVQWTAENKRSDDELSVLARACYALAGDSKHQNDIRHLRLWVRHAAHISEAEKVFDFLETEGIGLQHALLYEAWASHLERQRKFAAAEEQYQLGLQRKAEPEERLQSRYQEFQRRMCKRAARKGPKQPRSSRSERSSEPQKVPPLQAPVEPPLATATAATEHFAVHEDTALQPCEDEVELPVHDQVFIPIPARTLAVEVELPATQRLVRNEEVPAAPRVLARIGGTAEWKAGVTTAWPSRGMSGRRSSQASERSESRASLHSGNVTSDLTVGLRSLLADAPVGRRDRRSSSCGEIFEDPTYTAELAQREILALFATDTEAAVHAAPRAAPLRHLGSGGWGNRDAREASPRRTSSAFEILEETDDIFGR
eukprot:s2576_g1.t1